MYASDPVNRIMIQSVLTVGANELLEEALRFATAYPVEHLPVVEDGHVVGMLSSADIAKLKFLLPPPGPAREALLRQRCQVRSIMRSPALTITEHESAHRAAKLMADNGVHSLPVVNSKGALVGIVTSRALRLFPSSAWPSACSSPRSCFGRALNFDIPWLTYSRLRRCTRTQSSSPLAAA